MTCLLLRCDKCGVGTYGFGPTGCSECACDSVGSLNNQCDKSSGQVRIGKEESSYSFPFSVCVERKESMEDNAINVSLDSGDSPIAP